MSSVEFDRNPVAPQQLKPAKYFAASYAGEHVAGTEFVIGAMFVSWGVGTLDLLLGLIIGNLLAVLTWGLICAPIATDTRLTLYAYLEKIAGPGIIKLYSIVNGILFCVLAGAMITVSASAVRILFNLPAQVNWYPTDIAFVLVALAVGAVVVFIAVKGFKNIAQFAEVCAPWMILMFIAGALAIAPTLIAATPDLNSTTLNNWLTVADTFIWQANEQGLGWWHVAAFAWVCNMAMHGAMSDMTILRFARKSSYGFFSALGMFIGHFIAWICAGIMGAGAALLLKTDVTQLDAGAVAYQALGAAGIIAVIIAGWTTSNPTIYRAGLAFQSLNKNWDRTKVTCIVGIITTIIACFPFVFTKLMDFVSLMALLLAPVGAVIVCEHWVLPKLGLTRYWSNYKQQYINKAALISWLLTLLACYLFNSLGMHVFYLPVVAWFFALFSYLLLASFMGAKANYHKPAKLAEIAELKRKKQEQSYLANQLEQTTTAKAPKAFSFYLAILSLVICFGLALAVSFELIMLNNFKQIMIWPTLIYFISATYYSVKVADSDNIS
ncbi:nucleoside transporter [Catenovulum sp. 2E275]|uniref:nucleoside transporter n=1 Tax=Catenovulum sp. 2E275 TaxID=2980497 RepID=UPI0021D25012|nr:nucleoside transporter [Catenovulum sp. 2E275]MCU4674148.1 nucleoside transporter [Catenovulum sp. 2E275]